jgi:hypothetical protein
MTTGVCDDIMSMIKDKYIDIKRVEWQKEHFNKFHGGKKWKLGDEYTLATHIRPATTPIDTIKNIMGDVSDVYYDEYHTYEGREEQYTIDNQHYPHENMRHFKTKEELMLILWNTYLDCEQDNYGFFKKLNDVFYDAKDEW